MDFILHLDHHLGQIIARNGNATYAILFGIVFAETGLVLTPFLPGDSLLFAAGAFAALGKLAMLPLITIFMTAAILGDAVNYAAGSYFGEKALQSQLLNPGAIKKTQAFYRKHGGRAIVLARFVPIIRTFAPFVAGIGSMPYREFAAFNVGGAVVWVSLFCGAGFLFGNMPWVQSNFTLLILGIVAISVLPVFYEVWQARREQTPLSPGSGDA
eukprot:jgi/Astpho2/3116/fgenesh1_pm.00051_%23_43_t